MKLYFTTKKEWTLFSWLIKKYMKTSYSHVGLYFKYLGVDLVVEATGIFGVRIVTLENFLKKNKIIEEIKVTNSSKGNQAVMYCLSQLGDKYSWKSILGIALDKSKVGRDGENRFICSELMARAFGIRGKSLDHIDVKEFKEIAKEYL